MRPDWDPDSYDYAFPEDLVAHEPASPRDDARLLAYRREDRSIRHLRFRDLPDLLAPGSLLVTNDTRVVPARFVARKDTGGTVRLLYLGERDGLVEALADRPLRPGITLELEGGGMAAVTGKEGATYLLRPGFGDMPGFLRQHGITPLPPYIRTSLAEEDARSAYQTVFAHADGSAAAPTASLHFTPELLEKIAASGVRTAGVTLHVGLGTFGPLTETAIAEGALHAERYEVPAGTVRAIRKARAAGAPVIAVGTTVARALESAAEAGFPEDMRETRLFMRPGRPFQVVDQLVTNFHVPRSSLMQLVATLTGRDELMRVYREAVRERYRLFSFGDAMVVL